MILGLMTSGPAALCGLSVVNSLFYSVDSDVDCWSRWVVGGVNILSIQGLFDMHIFEFQLELL